MERILDSHVHLDLISTYHPDRIAWFIKNNVTLISWAFGEGIDTVGDLKRYFFEQEKQIQTLNGLGLPCYFLTGIHPRNIPPGLVPEDVSSLLSPIIVNPLCLGIGEIGLETGSALEKEVVVAQVEFALRLQKPGLRFGIHTPRRNKAVMTRELLQLIAPYGRIRPISVIDHCTRDTIDAVLAEGYHAGVTLSPAKTGPEELAFIIEKYRPLLDRIMCNTDSGSAFFQDLVTCALDDILDGSIKEKVFNANAARFFGV